MPFIFVDIILQLFDVNCCVDVCDVDVNSQWVLSLFRKKLSNTEDWLEKVTLVMRGDSDTSQLNILCVLMCIFIHVSFHFSQAFCDTKDITWSRQSWLREI